MSWLRTIRRRSNMTQEYVASQVGISRSYYARIENGKRGACIKGETAKKIAAVLDFDWVIFFNCNPDTKQVETVSNTG